MIERKFAPQTPTYAHPYGGGGGPGYGDYNNGMQADYGQFASYAPGQAINTAQPSYHNSAYASPIAGPGSSGHVSPYGSDYDEAASNPYLTRQPSPTSSHTDYAPRGSPSPVHYANTGADYVDLNRSSPVASFESPAFFAPMAADRQPLYSPHDQRTPPPPPSLRSGPPVYSEVNSAPPVSSEVPGRASEEYAKIVASSGYELPQTQMAGEHEFASRPSEDAFGAVVPGAAKPREKKAGGENVGRPETVYDEQAAYDAI